MSLSDDLRDELAAIAPRRRCCSLAELSALFHSAGAWHLRGHGELAVHLDLASPAAARRAFSAPARPRRPLGDPHLPPARVRPRDALPAPRRGRRRAAAEVLREAGVLSARGAPLERPPKRVVGRSCCRGAYLRGALLGGGSLSGRARRTSSCARAGADGARLLAEIAAREGIALAVARAPHARGRLREEQRDDRRPPRRRGRERDARSASTSTASSPRRAPRRTGWRTPTRPTSSGRSTRRRQQLEAIDSSTRRPARRSCRRSRRSG